MLGLAKLRTFFFGVKDREATFSQRGFYINSLTTVKHLELVGISFLRGYNLGLKVSDTKVLVHNLDQSKQFSGFCYEGAAMSLAILDHLSFFKKGRVKNLMNLPEGDSHIYMLHVGVGWAYARMPVRIERRMKQYNSLLRWLIVDGYGFHQAYFKTDMYVYKMKLPKQLKDPYSFNVFYQGVGRCLWFIECATPERIADRIALFPKKFQQDLWAGVGLACTYAVGVGEEVIINLKQLSGNYFPHLAQGAVFAAKARQRAGIVTSENELACKTICSISVETASSLADRCLASAPEGLFSVAKYEWWRHEIRNTFIKSKQYETMA